MSKKRMVIALGHKDLGYTLPEQYTAVRRTAGMVGSFIEKGYQVALVFSNAPQVGMIHTAMQDLHSAYPDQYTRIPLSVSSAMSQGFIGYDLQNAIHEELLRRGLYRGVSTILTQVLVDAYDPSCYEPVKRVGKKMTAGEARQEEADGNEVIALQDGSFQRIVPSPTPKAIIELDAIRTLLDADQVVIAVGGGGIPVVRQGHSLKGIAAIIEKDLAAGLLAREVDADILLITTAVDQVLLHYGTPEQEAISHMSTKEARTYIEQQHFEFRSMQPKVSAAISFVESGKGRLAIITSQELAEKAVDGLAGTTISD